MRSDRILINFRVKREAPRQKRGASLFGSWMMQVNRACDSGLEALSDDFAGVGNQDEGVGFYLFDIPPQGYRLGPF